MNALEKIRCWLDQYPQIKRLQGLKVDYYSEQPDNSSIAPSGLVEVSRKEDILGNVVVNNQYNFALYFVLPKAPGDDAGATENADWLLEFQEWVQEQSICHLTPKFGDDPQSERIKAQNGANEYADKDGTGIYTVHLSVEFTKKYEVKQNGKN